MLADARRRSLNSRGRTVKTGRRFGLADPANIRMVQLDDEFANQYMLVADHFISPQYRRRRHIVGIKPLQPIRSWTLLDDLRH